MSLEARELVRALGGTLAVTLAAAIGAALTVQPEALFGHDPDGAARSYLGQLAFFVVVPVFFGSLAVFLGFRPTLGCLVPLELAAAVVVPAAVCFVTAWGVGHHFELSPFAFEDSLLVVSVGSFFIAFVSTHAPLFLLRARVHTGR